jgi:hypothetical protein
MIREKELMVASRQSTDNGTAEHGIAADRFAREIVGFLKASPGALAAAECQIVGPLPHQPYHLLQAIAR